MSSDFGSLGQRDQHQFLCCPSLKDKVRTATKLYLNNWNCLHPQNVPILGKESTYF